MDLDDLSFFQSAENLLVMKEIINMPRYLLAGFEQVEKGCIEVNSRVDHILIAGMGNAVLAGDFLGVYANEKCAAQVETWRNYSLPARLKGDGTVVIFTGADEGCDETVSALHEAGVRGMERWVIAPDAKLRDAALAERVRIIEFPKQSQVNYRMHSTLGVLLALGKQWGWFDPDEDIHQAVKAMDAAAGKFLPDVPVASNPAKRMAGQLINRHITVCAADGMVPVARYWKEQINRIAKAWAQLEVVPEMNHASLAGIQQPADSLGKMVMVFLLGCEGERNRMRLDLTRQGFLMEGIPTDFYEAKGANTLTKMLTGSQFGDLTAFYLAVAYQHSPMPAEVLRLFAEAIHGE